MQNEKLISEKRQITWISITGYRVLIVLAALIKRGRSLDEIIKILRADSITKRSVSGDTARLTINTLRDFGCNISRPCKSNNFKYELIEHPFVLNLSEEDAALLANLRERLSCDIPYDDVFVLNSLYDKIAKLTKNKDIIDFINDTKPLNDVNADIANTLAKFIKTKKTINILYDSPQFGCENLDIIPKKINYENNKLYLWCYIFKYKKLVPLNISRILKINSIVIRETEEVNNFYEVQYKLFGKSAKTFVPAGGEKVVERHEDYIIVNMKVSNEFLAIQRLLLFGADFKIIYPDFFKETLINKLKKIKESYENAKV